MVTGAPRDVEGELTELCGTQSVRLGSTSSRDVRDREGTRTYGKGEGEKGVGTVPRGGGEVLRRGVVGGQTRSQIILEGTILLFHVHCGKRRREVTHSFIFFTKIGVKITSGMLYQLR